jgi:hypothetical protein
LSIHGWQFGVCKVFKAQSLRAAKSVFPDYRPQSRAELLEILFFTGSLSNRIHDLPTISHQ